jgi:predicted transcriptional regulator
MAIEPRPRLSAGLLHEVEETARAQNRNPEEIVGEAVRKYLDEQSWIKFVARTRRTPEQGASPKKMLTA